MRAGREDDRPWRSRPRRAAPPGEGRPTPRGSRTPAGAPARWSRGGSPGRARRDRRRAVGRGLPPSPPPHPPSHLHCTGPGDPIHRRPTTTHGRRSPMRTILAVTLFTLALVPSVAHAAADDARAPGGTL